jgi:hypothetical protein
MKEQDLRIIHVAAMATQERLSFEGRDQVAYPVRVSLSRPVSPFEAKFLQSRLGIEVDHDDAMVAVIPNTSLDALKTQISEWDQKIADAAADGRRQQDSARAEDTRLSALQQEINDQLGEQELR